MRSHNARVAVLLYTLVAGLALAMGFLRGDPDLYHHPQPLLDLPFWVATPLGIIVGGILGLGVVWINQRSVTTWRWAPARRLHIGFRQILGVGDSPLPEIDILAIAVSSAVAEEIFFRGWLSPLIGIVLSSLVFGLLHYAPQSKGMWVWIPIAFAMGLVFAGIYLVIGNLAAPIVAHGVINYRNLHFINNYDPYVVADFRNHS